MLNINSLTLAGRCEACKVEQTSTGKVKATLRVKVRETFGSNSYDSYFQCVAWGNAAEKCRQVAEGDQVAIQGRVVMRKYDDPRTGQTKEIYEVNVNTLDYDIGENATAGTKTAKPAQVDPDTVPF